MYNQLFEINQSYSVAFADYVRLKEQEGKSIIKMQTGDPDFPTHFSIVSGAKKALKSGETKYCNSRGLINLRNAISVKLFKENNLRVSSENILITHGAVHAINITIRALVNKGDECIIIEPYWRSYEANIILCGGTPVIVKANINDGFKLKASEVIKKITSKTKIVIINTPNNPSGAVYDKEELEKLVQYLYDRKIYLISDEVYESVIFSGKKHYSVGSNSLNSKYVISIFSFSKSHSMTGWRIGYLVATTNLIDQLLKLSQFSITSISPFIQFGALEALVNIEAKNYSSQMVKIYESRRDLITKLIRNTWLINNLIVPDGAFYALVNIERFNKKSIDFVMEMVDLYGVAFTPGIAFGDSMDNFIRICFATSEQNIEVAINALIIHYNSFIK